MLANPSRSRSHVANPDTPLTPGASGPHEFRFKQSPIPIFNPVSFARARLRMLPRGAASIQGSSPWNFAISARPASRCRRSASAPAPSAARASSRPGARPTSAKRDGWSTSASRPASPCSTRADIYSDGLAEEILGAGDQGPARPGAHLHQGHLPRRRRAQRRRLLALPPDPGRSRRACGGWAPTTSTSTSCTASTR